MRTAGDDLRATLRQYLDAWMAGDIEKGVSFYTDDMVVEIAGRSTISGTYNGKQDFRRRFIDRMMAITDGHWYITGVEDVLASEERVMAIVNEKVERKNMDPLEFAVLALYKIADGKIYKMWVWDDDPYAVEEYFADVAEPVGS